jgi:hypothetical protein
MRVLNVASSGTDTLRFEPDLRKVREGLRRFQKGITDFTEPNAQVAVFLNTWVDRNFQTQGGKVGGWAPLAESTLRRRRKGGKGAKILQDTGLLRASTKLFYDKTQAGIENQISVFSGAEKGSRGGYGIYHDSDDRSIAPWLPQRRFFPRVTDENMIGPVLKIWKRWVNKRSKMRLW